MTSQGHNRRALVCSTMWIARSGGYKVFLQSDHMPIFFCLSYSMFVHDKSDQKFLASKTCLFMPQNSETGKSNKTVPEIVIFSKLS